MKYGEYLGKQRNLISDILKILGIVGAFLFLDVFYSDAKIKSDILEFGCVVQYDQENIISDFMTYELYEIAKLCLDMRKIYASEVKYEMKFKKDDPSVFFDDTFRLSDTNFNYLNKIRDAMKFEFRNKTGSYREIDLSPNVINRAFWENTFIDTLIKVADSVSQYKAMAIILANREVSYRLIVSNIGSRAAKNVEIYMQAPVLLKPRFLIGLAEIEFLDIRSGNQFSSIENYGNKATINIPFMEDGDYYEFGITTTMANLTNSNIFINFETERKIEPLKVIRLLIILTILYFIAPFLIHFIQFSYYSIKNIIRSYK